MEAKIKRQGVVARTKAWYHPGTGGEEQPDVATTNALEGSNNNEGKEFNNLLDPPHDDRQDDEVHGYITTLLVATETYGGDEPEEPTNGQAYETCGDKTYFKFSNAGAGAHQYPGEAVGYTEASAVGSTEAKKAVGYTEANAVGATEVTLQEGTEVHIISENAKQGRGKAGVPNKAEAPCEDKEVGGNSLEVQRCGRGEVNAGKAGVLCTEVEDKSRVGGEEGKNRSAISTGGHCPASAVYHLIVGTPAGPQECLGGGARAGTCAGARARTATDDCGDDDATRGAATDWEEGDADGSVSVAGLLKRLKAFATDGRLTFEEEFDP